MDRYIVGFKSEQDVQSTLEAMEKKGWRWMGGQSPTQWNGWVRSNGDYTNFSLSYEDYFGQGCRRGNPADGETFINFKDVIKEINGNKSPTVTFDNIKDFVGKKFKATKNGYAIEGIIIRKTGNDGKLRSPGLRFNAANSNDTGWTTNDYPGYSIGWGICDKSDFNNIKDMTIIEDVDKSADVEIPKYFFVKKDENNVLFEEYIKWLNITYKCNWGGYGYKYYGYDGVGGSNGTDAFDHYDSFGNNAKEITLEFWNNCMNDISDPVTATETTQSYEKPTTTDAPDPETGIKYPTPYGTSVTELQEAPIKLRSAIASNITDAVRYGTSVSYVGGVGGVSVGYAGNCGINGSDISSPYTAPKVPVKKSRYSSMLDLI